jgi:hypothetical protein
MTLRSVTFAIYAADGWPADIGASSSRADLITSLTLGHYDAAHPDPDGGDRPRLEISTANDSPSPRTALHDARSKLESWLENDGTASQWPQASEAAITLWLAARRSPTRRPQEGSQRGTVRTAHHHRRHASCSAHLPVAGSPSVATGV